MRISFSIRVLLAIVLMCARGLAVGVIPRIKRQRIIAKLEHEPLVSNILGLGIASEPSAFDTILGCEGPVEYLGFEGRTDENDVLTAEVFVNAYALSPLIELTVDNVSVKPCTVYPFAEKLVIRSIRGEEINNWLRGLLTAQTCLKEIEVEWTTGFSDEHLEILCGIKGLERISLLGTSATGVGLRRDRNCDHAIELDIVDCPITDDGLRVIAECDKLESVFLDFPSRVHIPDLRILFTASRSLDLTIRLGRRSSTTELMRMQQEMDDYFGHRTLYFETSK